MTENVERKKQYFMQYGYLKVELESKQEYIEQLKTFRDNISVKFNEIVVKINGYSDKNNLIDKIIDLENETLQEIKDLMEVLQEIKNAVESVQHPKLRAVLTHRYINLYSKEKTAEKMKESPRNVAYLTVQALEMAVIPSDFEYDEDLRSYGGF